MGDHDRAAGEVLEAFLEGADRIDIHVVGRLVEEQDVGVFLEGQGQVQAVALAAGEDAAKLLLVGAREVEAGDVGPGVDFAVAQLHVFAVFGDRLIDRQVGVNLFVLLVHVGDLHRLSYLKCT